MTFTRRTVRLTFQDEAYAGLEIVALPMSLGQLLDSSKLEADGQSGAAGLDAFMPVFAAALVEWNLVNLDGTPVPMDVDGLRTLDVAFLADTIRAWAGATAGMSRPLAPSSNGGDPSEEQDLSTLPMEALSASPSS